MTFSLSIALSVIIFVLGVSAVIFYFFLERKKRLERGTRIYKYDQTTRMVTPKELRKFRYAFSLKKEEFSALPKLIDEELAFAFSSPGEKVLRQALHDCTKQVPAVDIDFKAKLPEMKGQDFDVKMNFHLSEDNQYILVMSWKLIPKIRNWFRKKVYAKKIDKNDLNALPAKLTGYVVFNIKREESTEKRLIDIISSVWRKEFEYFVSSGILAVVFQSESNHKIAHDIEEFTKKFVTHGVRIGAHQLYSGSAYAYVADGHLAEQQKKLLQVLEFFINLSIDKNVDFLTPHKDELVNQDENRKFLEGLEVFRKAIRDKNIDLDLVPVKGYVSNKRVAYYVVPKVKGLNPYVQSIIVRNANNKRALRSTAAELVCKSTEMPAVLVDVGAAWLMRNVSNLENKKAVYVIDVNDQIDSEKLRLTLEKLTEDKFTFGLRVSTYDEKASILIKRCKVKFIVIDQKFMGNGDLFDSNAYIDLLTIAEMAKKANIQMIYEKPSNFIDKATSEKIGLKYFY